MIDVLVKTAREILEDLHNGVFDNERIEDGAYEILSGVVDMAEKTKREFYINTPLGNLKVWAKHDSDTPEDYPGVFIDFVNEKNGDTLLSCVEYDHLGGGIYTRVYGDADNDAPTDSIFHEGLVDGDE